MQVQCANPGCRGSVHSLRLKLGMPPPGRLWEDRWFCSHACYIAHRSDAFIAAKQDHIHKVVRRLKLGLLMLKNNRIDKETLNDALERQRRSGEKLGEVLVASGKITPKELKSFLSIQAGVAPVSLDPGLTVKRKEEIPFKLLREYHFVCFKFDDREKTISIAVYELELIAWLEEMFADIYPGYLVKFYLDDKEKIIRILAANYPNETLDTAAAPAPAPPGNELRRETLVYKMVDLLTQNGAEEIKIDHLAGAVHILSEIDGLTVRIDISAE